MELYGELLCDFFMEKGVKITLAEDVDLANVVETECYKALCEIKEIIQDNTLDDSDCFEKIEEIVCLLESKGIDCGTRHDFG